MTLNELSAKIEKLIDDGYGDLRVEYEYTEYDSSIEYDSGVMMRREVDEILPTDRDENFRKMKNKIVVLK